MENKVKQSLLILLFAVISFSSCSDGYDDQIKEQSIYLNIEEKNSISVDIEKKYDEKTEKYVFIDGKFDLTVDTSIYSYDLQNSNYVLLWGNDTLKYVTYVIKVGNDDTKKIRVAVPYQESYNGKNDPVRIEKKASKEVLATGPNVSIKIVE